MDKLSKDMIACREAGFGVHYGAWKATQEQAKQIPIKTDNTELRCLNCGKIIVQESRRTRKFCDSYCGKIYRCKCKLGILEEG